MADGRLLATASLPSSINCVALDAGEHAMYAGGTGGTIFEISLVGYQSGGGSAADPLYSLASRSGGAFGGGGAMGGITSTSASSSSASASSLGFVCMEGHSRAVNSVALSPDGETMVSGSDDGTAFVWDLRSRQVRTGL